mgnify:CR=1 FL=1
MQDIIQKDPTNVIYHSAFGRLHLQVISKLFFHFYNSKLIESIFLYKKKKLGNLSEAKAIFLKVKQLVSDTKLNYILAINEYFIF